jgi:hypothetical protein
MLDLSQELVKEMMDADLALVKSGGLDNTKDEA